MSAKLTSSSDETNVERLLSNENIFTIPLFQRPYKWKAKRLETLQNDLISLAEGENDRHFLGAIIIHSRSTNPSDPTFYDVIDGQQRITTLFLYICAAVKTLRIEKEYELAAGYYQKFLIINRSIPEKCNYKLQSCREDRAMLNRVFDDLHADQKFKNRLGSLEINKLTDTGKPTGVLWKNYQLALRFFKHELEQGGQDRVKLLLESLLKSVSVVQIDVQDPANGPKIFDSLNSAQEPMTIGDLVRNEIFSRVTDQEKIDRVDANSWLPFHKSFEVDGKNHFDLYFFPFGLTQDPNLKKSDVFSTLKESWKSQDDPSKIISELTVHQATFIDLISGQNTSKLTKEIASLIHNMFVSKAPKAIYPFIFQLVGGIKSEDVSDKEAAKILRLVESFLVRRAVCGLEPTGLHAVFKRLWQDCEGEWTQKSVEAVIRGHRTVQWPSDQLFKGDLENRSLDKSGISKFILGQYDERQSGDRPGVILTLEHILPQSCPPAWRSSFGKTDCKQYVGRLANLLPLSGSMNSSIGDEVFDVKRERYLNDSAFKSVRDFAQRFKTWTPDDIHRRSEEISSWALERWPN